MAHAPTPYTLNPKPFSQPFPDQVNTPGLLIPDGVDGELQPFGYFAVAVTLDKAHAHNFPALGGQIVDLLK